MERFALVDANILKMKLEQAQKVEFRLEVVRVEHMDLWGERDNHYGNKAWSFKSIFGLI